jgi:hypothetical protein
MSRSIKNKRSRTSQISRGADILANTPIGVSNISRSFSVDDDQNGPQVILRQDRHAFTESWSATGLHATGDTTAAISVLEADPTTELYPMTPLADGFLNEYWPSLNGLLSSGLGTRFTPSSAEIIRYFAIAIRAYEWILCVLQANHLAYKMDWTNIGPNTPGAPSCAFNFADSWDATNVGINDRWRPYIDRLAEHVLPPVLVAELNIHAFPMVATPFGHQLVISSLNPTYFWNYSPDTIETIVSDYLDYLDTTLVQTANVLKTFTPWRIGVPAMATKNYSARHATGLYNSGFQAYPAWGSTLPVTSHAATIGSSSPNGDQAIIYHLGNRPTIGELVNTAIFELSDTEEYSAICNRIADKAYVVADNGVDILSYADNESDSAETIRYANYIPNRFRIDEPFVGADAGPTQGRGQVPYLSSIVSTDQVYRVNRDYLLYQMGISNIRDIALIAGGSSMRELRDSIRPFWQPKM